ncbi:MAG: hypothetical protein Kow00103_03620 [Candidatus Caldatribacteriota bacterium]
MKKNFHISILFIIIFLLATVQIFAKIDVGGELTTSLINIIDEEGKIFPYLQGSLDLELFLPSFNSTQPKFEIYLFNNPIDGSFDYLIKKLYLKHKFEKLHLTIGRQLISWSFGSMLNPVDFTLGAVVAEEETLAKFQNALEIYVPLDWSTSLSLVAALPENSEEIKWGLRGRTNLEGYDLTLNYVREPEIDFMGTILPASQRIGFTVKGDLGPIGIYGALGYYFKNNNDNGNLAFLIGGDYSYFFEAGNKIYFQLEYLSLKKENLSSILGAFFVGEISNNLNENVGLILGMINYEIDEFSQVNLMTISSLNDGSIIIMPGYRNQLSNSLSLDLGTAIYFGQEDSLFGPNTSEGVQLKPKGMISIGLTYSF